MKIVVAARCRNEINNIARFLRGYDFADKIVISDGGSTDGSLECLASLKKQLKIDLHHFSEEETINGETWNPDAPHINFVLDKAKELEPDFLIFDDMDCVPTFDLRSIARDVFREAEELKDYQVNAFRLYLWGDREYFPKMNSYFNPELASLWAWRPDKIDIHADLSVRHGTLTGIATENVLKLKPPYSLLHKSWHPDTIAAKVARYNALGLNMDHPLAFAGTPEALPEWAREL